MSAKVESDELFTIDELAASVGMTVRTTRYYAGKGLLPPPARQGRLAYYTAYHQARLELIRALQDHGFTLSAIEKYFSRIPSDATAEDLAVQRAMLTPWTGATHELQTRRQVERRAGRRLSDEELQWLERIFALRQDGDSFEVLPPFAVAIALMDVDIPVGSMVAAGDAIASHMDALAEELTEILHAKVLVPFREQEHSESETARFEQTMSRLRQLTLEAVVAGFQRSANAVITRSLTRDQKAQR